MPERVIPFTKDPQYTAVALPGRLSIAIPAIKFHELVGLFSPSNMTHHFQTLHMRLRAEFVAEGPLQPPRERSLKRT